jgi:nicotinamide mononucleotide transporter
MLDWLARIIAPLNNVLFHMAADAVTWAELLGFITGAICVYLVVRANVHNFWTGILNSALFLVLFTTARLWADASLQFVYIVLGFVGWWQWLHGGQNRTALKVGRASARMLLACLALVVLGTLVLTPVLREAHDIAPFLDALTTSLSLAAQVLLNAKKIQNWLFWIVADVIYIPLYFVKHLNLTGTVYVGFLGLAISGAIQWRRLDTTGGTTGSPQHTDDTAQAGVAA